jgi:hypothetical protein
VEGVFAAHPKQDILSACYLPKSGMALATGMRGGGILLWCAKTAQARSCVSAHGPGTPAPSVHTGKPLLPGVCALMLTKQQNQLVSAGGDGCIIWWNIPAPSVRAHTEVGLRPASKAALTNAFDGSTVALQGLDCSPFGGPEVVVTTVGCDAAQACGAVATCTCARCMICSGYLQMRHSGVCQQPCTRVSPARSRVHQ